MESPTRTGTSSPPGAASTAPSGRAEEPPRTDWMAVNPIQAPFPDGRAGIAGGGADEPRTRALAKADDGLLQGERKSKDAFENQSPSTRGSRRSGELRVHGAGQVRSVNDERAGATAGKHVD